jgi:hypothetical protein
MEKDKRIKKLESGIREARKILESFLPTHGNTSARKIDNILKEALKS